MTRKRRDPEERAKLNTEWDKIVDLMSELDNDAIDAEEAAEDAEGPSPPAASRRKKS